MDANIQSHRNTPAALRRVLVPFSYLTTLGNLCDRSSTVFLKDINIGHDTTYSGCGISMLRFSLSKYTHSAPHLHLPCLYSFPMLSMAGVVMILILGHLQNGQI